MKLDAHVHTQASGNTTIRPLSLLMRESYNTPERAYRLAKARGMDLVAITDHDTVAGALALVHHPDVIVGSEVSAKFPGTGTGVHLGVLDITEEQQAEINRLRGDVTDLLPYLREQHIFTTVNHVASQANGRITPAQIASLVPWVDAFEVINGSRLPSLNRTAASLAPAYGKTMVAGSDSHTGRGIGRTCTVVDDATTKDEFMAALRFGRARVEGLHGGYFGMASDIVRMTGRFHQETWLTFLDRPLAWQRPILVLGALLGAPLVAIPLLCAVGHFIEEARFNRRLLFDLVSRPVLGRAPAPHFGEAA